MIESIKKKSRSQRGHDQSLALLRLVLFDRQEQQLEDLAHDADVFCATLPLDQLKAVLSEKVEGARDVFIGGIVEPKSDSLTLVRGNQERIIVPLSIFCESGTTKPDFRRFAVDDFGQTIRFGDYEAAADFVLYAVDPEYRRRANARRRECAKGFGPSLRRLRVLRKLGRDDFSNISAKTIARIERGEVEKPRGQTLRVISKTLGVEAEDIETY